MQSEPLRIYTPTWTNVLNTTAAAFPIRGGMWFRRYLEEPGLVEVFGRADITMGAGLTVFSLSVPPGVGAIGAGDVIGHGVIAAGSGGNVFSASANAGAILFTGTGVAGTQLVTVTCHIYAT